MSFCGFPSYAVFQGFRKRRRRHGLFECDREFGSTDAAAIVCGALAAVMPDENGSWQANEYRERTNWYEHEAGLDEPFFKRRYRLTKSIFYHILAKIRPSLDRNERMLGVRAHMSSHLSGGLVLLCGS
jgi:hypothetical protein